MAGNAGGILIGIDIGTTVFKACAFDARTGQALARAGVRLPISQTKHGAKREMRPRALLEALDQCMGLVCGEIGGAAKNTLGIGVASQGGSNCVANRKTGTPKTPMVLWNDGRSGPYLERLGAGPDFWRELHLRDLPAEGLGRLLMLRERYPQYFVDGFIHCGAGELTFHRLTQEWRQDPGHAIQIGAYDARAQQLDPRPFDLIGLDLDFIAPLRQGHETAPLSDQAANRYGLPTGIPVAGPYIDQEAGYLSAQLAGARPLQCSLGTAWVGNFELPRGAGGGSEFQLPLPPLAGGERLVVQPLLTGNAFWDWGCNHLAAQDAEYHSRYESANSRLRGDYVPPEGLTAIPYLAQANPLAPNAHGAAAFSGIGPNVTRDDLLRALVAGMCCELRRVFEHVAQCGAADCVVIGGGTCNSAAFRKFIAALFHPLSVRRQMDPDLAGARGCLYAFSRDVAASRNRAVKPPHPTVLAGARRAYDDYLTLHERVCGGMPGAGVFRCEPPSA